MEFTASIVSETFQTPACFVPEMVYAKRDTRDLKMQLVIPSSNGIGGGGPRGMRPLMVDGVCVPHRHRGDDPKMDLRRPEPKKWPVVVICPGSGFDGTRGFRLIDVAIELAHRGYAAAIIEYRGSQHDRAAYPAYVQDCKEAVRYLRANAERLCVDPERIALMGDSSGGNCVAMAGLTPGETLFEIGENLDCSSEVGAVISFFGPVDPMYLLNDRIKAGKSFRPGEKRYPFEAYEIYEDRFEEDPEGHLFECSVSNHVKTGTKLPAFAYFIGDEDNLIPMEQGLRLCQKIRDCGGRAEIYRIIGAGHGDGCFFPGTFDLICKFLDTFLKSGRN